MIMAKVDDLNHGGSRPAFDPLLMLALVTMAAGLLFKVAAVPFHQWAPDIYEGAPTPVTAFLSVASTAASFGLLIRLFVTVFWPVRDQWTFLLGAVAVASMTVGNLAAHFAKEYQAHAGVLFDFARGICFAGLSGRGDR